MSDSGRKTTDVRSSPSAQELQLVALRQQLALDETKRNVPAGMLWCPYPIAHRNSEPFCSALSSETTS